MKSIFLALALSSGLCTAPPAQASPPVTYSEITRGFAFVDNGVPGRSIGDVITYVAELHGPSGQPLGHKSGRCVTEAVDRGDFVATCTETIYLASGALYTAGRMNQSAMERFEPQAIPVVGGSGAYQGKTGTQVIHQVAYPDKFATTIALDSWSYTRP